MRVFNCDCIVSRGKSPLRWIALRCCMLLATKAVVCSACTSKIRDIHVTNVTKDLEFTDTPDKSPKISGILDGTSFSNIGWLADHHDEMMRKKREGD